MGQGVSYFFSNHSEGLDSVLICGFARLDSLDLYLHTCFRLVNCYYSLLIVVYFATMLYVLHFFGTIHVLHKQGNSHVFIFFVVFKSASNRDIPACQTASRSTKSVSCSRYPLPVHFFSQATESVTRARVHDKRGKKLTWVRIYNISFISVLKAVFHATCRSTT